MEKKPLNENSKKEELELQKSVIKLFDLIKDKFPLPKYWEYKFEKSLSLKMAKRIKILNGYDEDDLNYLLENRKVEPDGGVIYAIKKDSSCNIEKINILLITEAKHQNSGTGNAIERWCKNFNLYKDIFNHENIFPFITFAAGKDFSEETVRVKLNVGGSNEITNNTKDIRKDVILVNERKEYKPKILFLTKDDFSKWEENEIFFNLIEVFKQSFDYFFSEKNKIIRCEAVII